MDSSITSCDVNKNFKPKFNATANTQLRRNKMMCSTWKISVFAIVALMLTFAMTTDDAAAQTDYSPVVIAVGGAADLRAAETVAAGTPITFAITTTETATKDGSITITIPGGWSRPFPSDATDTRAGAVSNDPATAPENTSVRVSGNQLIFNVKKDVASTTMTFSYRNAKLPVRAGTYTFNVSSTIHDTLTRLDSGNGITGDEEAETLKGDGRYIAINVGPVPSGKGAFALTSPSLTTGAGDYKMPDDGSTYTYVKHKLVYAEQELGNLVFTFTAPGTMLKDSLITLELPGASGSDTTPAWQTYYRQDSNGGAGSVSVQGANLDAASTATTVVAKLGATVQAGHQVRFIVNSVKAPKVEDAATATNLTAVYNVDTTSLPDTTATQVDDTVSFTVHGKHGTGKVTIPAASMNRAGGAAANLEFTFNPGGVMLQGSMIEITVPNDWTPAPFIEIGTGTHDGRVTGATGHDLKVDGRKIIITLATAIGITDPATAITVTYHNVKAPAAQGGHTFSSRANSHKQGSLMPIESPTINVITGHGSGTISLMRGGSAFTQAASEASVGTLMFIYSPAGFMPKDSKIRINWPSSWPAPRGDNADGRYDEGEMVVSPADKASLEVERANATLGHVATITASTTLTASDRITLAYRNVKVPKADPPRSDTFETRVISGPLGDGVTDNAAAFLLPGTRLDSSPVVGIGQVPDGSGSIMASISEADAGSTVGMIDFTYTAAGSMAVGAQVEITVPDGWSLPALENNDGVMDAGESSVTGVGAPTLSVNNNVLTVTLGSPLSSGEQFKITYKNVLVPSAGGSYRFATKSKVSSSGEPSTLTSGSPTIVVSQVASGSIALTSATGPLTSAMPGEDLGNLVFTFAAGAQMQTGAQVMVTVPLGWTHPFIDNNDGVDTAGEVSLTGMADLSVSGGGAQPWVLTATTSSTLEAGNTLTFTYKNVQAPAAEQTYVFNTNVSISPGARALPLSSEPSVIVRASVAAIALHAMPTSVFAGDDVNIKVDLWSAAGELAKALGAQTVVMTSTSDTGEFSNDMGTIPDNMSEWTGTYSDDTAGMVTITATVGELSDSVDVEVKSTIRDLVVDNMVVKGGSTIMVSATGKAGGGTVTILDSEGEKVGTKKALDPVDDPDDDGDQEYSRSVTLPATLADGMYTLSVEIQGATDNSLMIEVVNDQTPPSVSKADVSEDVVVNGDTLTISADVAMNESMVEIASVMADLGGLDSTKADGVMLDELSSSPGKYFTIITVDDANEAEDGEYTITVTATDAIGNMGSDMVMVTLENDPSELTSAEVTPGSAKPGETIWIKAMGSAGAKASATVNSAADGMMIAQVTLEEDAANAGMYSGGLMIVEDAHPAGMYDVTVTLGTQMMTLEDALTIEPPGYDFTLSIGAGTHLIHVPLAVTQVNGADMEIATVRDLYNALGDAVNIIISLGADGSWNSYLGDDAPGMAFGDMMLGDSTGLVAVMNSAVTLELTGNALGTGGVSTIMLNAGNNLVGVPLDSAQISMISDVLGTLVSAVVVSNEAGNGFQTITQAGDPGDGPLMGGEGYIVVAAAAASIPVIGSPWQNMDDGGMMSAPPVAFGANVKTPVLHVRGQLVDEAGMMTLDGLTVSVRNVTSGSVLGSGVATDEYSMTFVKLNSSAAKVGDILEIKADSGNPLLGIRPVQHVVTAEDVLNGSISLPDLVTYEIPAQSELLANYPNPFNPETWIPFRLAEDASVSLDIYGASGALVRSIDLGFTPAAVYEGRSDAIYWDGRNNFGEQVSSGLYFYHLRAGEFSATRRMVIVK